MCQMGCVSAVEGSEVYVCRWYHVVSLTETIEGKFLPACNVCHVARVLSIF